MRVMTSNQWKCDVNYPAWKARGEDSSSEGRAGGLIRAYQMVLPDVIGLQEVSTHMTDLMMPRMRSFQTADGITVHYDIVTGGDTPLLYRDDRLELKASGFFRYDESVPGYDGCFNNSGTKSYTWGVFRDRNTGRRIAIMSTHLWWMSSDPISPEYQAYSDEARAYQIGLAIARMEQVSEKYGCPSLIVGDFNATIDSPCFVMIRQHGWIEAYDCTQGERDETSGYHMCNADGYAEAEPGSFAEAIDHVILRKDCHLTVTEYKRVMEPWFNPISDHYPLYIGIAY